MPMTTKEFNSIFSSLDLNDPGCRLLAKLLNESLKFDTDRVSRGDAVWMLRSAFAVLAMQSGFALLETGCVKPKNVTNIKVKNAVDVAIGGLSYWLFGYALSFGKPSTTFFGLGNFAPNDASDSKMGTFFTMYFYQFTLASSATTIISGAVAERMAVGAYVVYSFLSIISYSVPVSWAWNRPHGLLQSLGFYDFAEQHNSQGAGMLSPQEIQEALKTADLTTKCGVLLAFLNQTLIFDADRVSRGDAVWQLRSAFAILTMQSGFALLETGCVKPKNVVNLKVKNAADVAMGGLSYWLFGYGLSFGRPANAFCGFGHFAPNLISSSGMGTLLTLYFYQFTLASSSTTILSGAVAERITLGAYCSFSFLSTIIYAIPASWTWNKPYGFLQRLGFYDFAGTCVVHGNGGIAALVAAIMIGPRLRRWEHPEEFGMTSPVTALTGTLLLWWAWFAFNCGSTLGSIGEDGHLWKINALVAVNTLNGSVGGACFGIFSSMLLKKGQVDVTWLISSILGGLVAITGICSVTSPLECLFIGAVGAVIAITTTPLLQYYKIDDPVGAVPVHFFASIWGTLSVGLFGRNDEFGTLGNNGLFHGGGFYLLGVQALGLVCIASWSALTTFVFMLCIDKTIGIRMTREQEEAGADYSEHGINKADGLRGMVAKELDREPELMRLYADEMRKRSAMMLSFTSPRMNITKEPNGRVCTPVVKSDSGEEQIDMQATEILMNGDIPSSTSSTDTITASTKLSGSLGKRESVILPKKFKRVARFRVGSFSSVRKRSSVFLRSMAVLPNVPEVSH